MVASACIGLCLKQYDGSAGESFDPRRVGVDHLALLARHHVRHQARWVLVGDPDDSLTDL